MSQKNRFFFLRNLNLSCLILDFTHHHLDKTMIYDIFFIRVKHVCPVCEVKSRESEVNKQSGIIIIIIILSR